MTTREQISVSLRGGAIPALLRQARTLQPVVLFICAIVGIAYGILIAVRIGAGIPIAEITRDPLGFTDIPVYKGALSNVGAVIWSGAAAICLFSYGVIRTRAADSMHPRFLLVGGFITAVLMADDLFMLHEVVFPEYLGVIEEIVYATYAALLLWFLVWFRSTILQTDFLLLGLALAGFGVSIGVDLTTMFYSVPGLYIFEDGGKFFGIVSWAAYFVLVSARYIASAGHEDPIANWNVIHHVRNASETATGANSETRRITDLQPKSGPAVRH